MRVIPIGNAGQPSACAEGDGAVPKLNLPLARREFLKGSGILMGTIAAGSALAALAPSSAWAVELKTLSTAEGQTLMKMGRVLYPHKKLADAVYALLAKDLDGKASGEHFGYPYIHGNNVQIAGTAAAPDLKDMKAPAPWTKPQIELPAHQAQLGMTFYTGKQFPAKYQGGIFVAAHGS